MARKKSGFGRNLGRVLEGAPAQSVREFLASWKAPDDVLLQLPFRLETVEEEQKSQLSAFLEIQDREILDELDQVAAGILDLAQEKGITSLETVASKRLDNTEYEEFAEQPDPLCKSLWAHVRFPNVFRDAESFHAARRYREHKQMYASLEVDADHAIEIEMDTFDETALSREVESKLRLKSKARVSILDLPKTPDYPASVMIALRHAGPLSSIQDHRDNGVWQTYYYRPSHEAVMIYTPKLKKIEICAQSFDVRQEISNAFAKVVLNQDISSKPLENRNFNLDRFRRSFDLDRPDFADTEIEYAVVIEAEMPLGAWSRRINVKVTKNENIERVMTEYLRSSSGLIRLYGFSRIVIAVGYTRRDTRRKGTLRLTISGGNSSSVQSQNDPYLRDLGYRLLTCWGLLNELRTLTEAETAERFGFLLALYDLPGEVVSGAFFSASGVDPTRLVDAGFIQKNGRQVLVLIDEDDLVVEADLQIGAKKGSVHREGAFGEDFGEARDADAIEYRIDRRWLSETILKAVMRGTAFGPIEILDDHLASVGRLASASESIPVYMVRNLGNAKVRNRIEEALRQRHVTGPGIVLAVSEDPPRFLGPNVVVALRNFLSVNDDIVQLDTGNLKQAFEAGRSLVTASIVAQIIRHGTSDGTLILPGEEPLALEGANQITLFERLVDAARKGPNELRSKVLTDGMGSDNPRQLFSDKKWKQIFGIYISHGASNRYWRLGKPLEPA